MSNARYIEINSTYRDRTIWPLAAEFEIPISQTGTKSIKTAVDPVSLAMPIFSWSSNNLTINGTSNISGYIGSVATVPSACGNICYSSDISSLIIACPNPLQQLRNYYSSLVINDTTAGSGVARRITTSYYLGYSSGNYRMQINLGSPYSDNTNLGDVIQINDPTDFSDTSNPLIFVPNGALQENAYHKYILYNETCNQYRPILQYDNITDIIQLNTTTSSTSTYSSGPITVGAGNWQTTDNFSLRQQPPMIPLPGGVNPTILNTVTYNVPGTFPIVTKTISTSSNLIIITGATLSTIENFYKNEFLRVLPYGDVNTNPTDPRYEYDPTPTNNQARRITGYNYYEDSTIPGTYYGVFNVYPEFNLYNNGIGASIEILQYSFDNFNPFIYTGSLVSQQEMVCYEMQMISLTMPNAILAVGQGGRIAFYPYVYVQISNVSAAGAGLKNIIYSNNPNSTNVIFRAPIYDVQNPLNTPFVRVDGEGMTQTIKFKPNDNLYFRVSLSTGETYKTILEEYFSPASPNPYAQITALFSFKRI
jgi:hypothetical protein